jgi:MFS family permease
MTSVLDRFTAKTSTAKTSTAKTGTTEANAAKTSAAKPNTPIRRRLPPTVSFFLLASIVVTLLASSSAPTPLYGLYQAQWGFSAITTTVVFASYAVAVLVSLLIAGSLSDHIGRRPVLLAGLLVQVATMWVFVTADGVPQLIVARIVQGLATGAALGAVGAGMLDLNRERGTIANAVAPMSGTAIGALLAGIFVQLLPAPTTLVYAVLSIVFLVQAVGVVLMPETTPARPGALASLRPELGLPLAARRAMLTATPVLFAAWALGGFYLSLGPALVRLSVHSDSRLLGGAAVFAMAGTAAVVVLLLRNVSAVRTMMTGILLLIAGVAVTEVAVATGSTAALFAGMLVSGAGFGASVQGSIRTVMPAAQPHERAGLLSLVYIVSYFGLGLPAVLAGMLVVYGGGLHATAQQYGVAVIVLAATALLGFRKRREA